MQISAAPFPFMETLLLLGNLEAEVAIFLARFIFFNSMAAPGFINRNLDQVPGPIT